MSIPDPDETMEVRLSEQIEETDFDFSNANDMDDDMGQSALSPVLPEDSDIMMEQLPRYHLVDTLPFDLEIIGTTFQGPALISRLKFIAEVCPPLQKNALIMLINYIVENTFDVQEYLAAHRRLDALRTKLVPAASTNGTAASGPIDAVPGPAAAVEVPAVPSVADPGAKTESDSLPQVDTLWVDATASKAQTRLEALMAEYKRHKEEGVKESIRRAMVELFHFYLKSGQLHEAAKIYGRGLRDFCTTPKHVVQMQLDLLEVTVHIENWQRIDPILIQIERAVAEALEAESVAATSTSRASRFAIGATQAATKNIRELIKVAKAKMAAITALYRLNSKSYRQVAECCVKIDIDYFDCPTLISVKDIALFGTICALATFDRTELKKKVLGSVLFCKFLESEPKVIQLLEKFCNSQFGDCFDILAMLRDQLLVNMYLWSHVNELYQMIRKRAIIQYFTPYLIADMNTMASVFRTTTDSMEAELVQLIEKDELKARIDSCNKKLCMKNEDKVLETYNHLMKVNLSLGEHAHDIVLRAALYQAQIVVGSNEAGIRGRRRAAQGHSFGDDSDDRSPGKLYKNDGTTASTTNANSQAAQVSRSFMSRIFGSNRAAIPPITEPDSSNESSKTSAKSESIPSGIGSQPVAYVPPLIALMDSDASQRMEAEELQRSVDVNEALLPSALEFSDVDEHDRIDD